MGFKIEQGLLLSLSVLVVWLGWQAVRTAAEAVVGCCTRKGLIIRRR